MRATVFFFVVGSSVALLAGCEQHEKLAEAPAKADGQTKKKNVMQFTIPPKPDAAKHKGEF
jgi:hypothetical protein